MKRAIAGILLLVGIGVAPALAWDGGRRDIRHDEAKIAHDRHELRRDLSGPIEASFGKASLDRYGAALDPAKFTKPQMLGAVRERMLCYSNPHLSTRWSAPSTPAARAPLAATPQPRRRAM